MLVLRHTGPADHPAFLGGAYQLSAILGASHERELSIMHPLIATSTGPAGLVIHPYTQLVPMTAFDRIVGLRLLAAHQFIYELSGGRIGEQLGRVHMLLLHTTGRKTGRPRTAALLYHRDRDCYVVVGSKGGSDTPPAWLLNLKAIPDVEVQIGTRRFQAKARVASSEEKRRLWPEVTTLWPQYDRYQSQTGRAIPLVILKPQSSC